MVYIYVLLNVMSELEIWCSSLFVNFIIEGRKFCVASSFLETWLPAVLIYGLNQDSHYLVIYNCEKIQNVYPILLVAPFFLEHNASS